MKLTRCVSGTVNARKQARRHQRRQVAGLRVEVAADLEQLALIGHQAQEVDQRRGLQQLTNWFINAGSTRRMPCGTTTNRIDDE